MGYLVRCIRRASNSDSSDTPTGADENQGTGAVHNSEKYILELQPTERGLQSKIIEADLVLWTVGSKSSLTQIEPSDDAPFVLPLNGRGQAETDETLRVKGHPRIFALGDSSALRDSHGRILPATAQVYYPSFLIIFWHMHKTLRTYYLVSLLICFPLPFRLHFSKQTLLVGICGLP